MPATYEKIATTTLGSATNLITFSSIASSWTDIRLVFSVKAASGGAVAPLFQFNSDTGTTYSYTRLLGDGSSATSARLSDTTSIRTGASSIPASGVGLLNLDIFSYAGSTYKTVLIDQNTDANGSGAKTLAVCLWRSTSAINRIDISAGNDFDSGTTATLYGILKA